MGIGDLIGNKLWAQCWTGNRIIGLDVVVFCTQARECCQSNRVFIRCHMGFCNLSPWNDCQKMDDTSGSFRPYLRFILDSTLSRSLKSIPHGLAGVASSINRPNSGWKWGGSPSSLRILSMVRPSVKWSSSPTLPNFDSSHHPFLSIKPRHEPVIWEYRPGLGIIALSSHVHRPLQRGIRPE